jgi:DNA-binding transcriptional MerR regulator
MRVSELVERSGTPLPTIKYYLREGLLMPGLSRGATRAEYGEEHVRRLRLIRALGEVAGLPVARIKLVLELIDGGGDLFGVLGAAVAALAPGAPAPEDAARRDYPRARAALEAIGQVYDPGYPAVAGLERALAAVDDAGIPMTPERLAVYAEHIMAIARFDLGAMPGDRARAVEYAVLGTALYEPVLAAMRQLAHQDIASKLLSG